MKISTQSKSCFCLYSPKGEGGSKDRCHAHRCPHEKIWSMAWSLEGWLWWYHKCHRAHVTGMAPFYQQLDGKLKEVCSYRLLVVAWSTDTNFSKLEINQEEGSSVFILPMVIPKQCFKSPAGIVQLEAWTIEKHCTDLTDLRPISLVQWDLILWTAHIFFFLGITIPTVPCRSNIVLRIVWTSQLWNCWMICKSLNWLYKMSTVVSETMTMI